MTNTDQKTVKVEPFWAMLGPWHPRRMFAVIEDGRHVETFQDETDAEQFRVSRLEPWSSKDE